MINGNALSQIRTERGISQRKLALLVGLNYQVIRRLEAGGDDSNLLIRDLAKLCTTLNVAATALLQDPDTQDPPITGAGLDELDLAQAKLLRRVQRGEDLRRGLTTEGRELVLPSLLRLQLIASLGGGRMRLTSSVALELSHPDARE